MNRQEKEYRTYYLTLLGILTTVAIGVVIAAVHKVETEIIIIVTIFVILLAIGFIVNWQSQICPTCGKRIETIRLDSTNILLENSIPGKRTVIIVYKCHSCGYWHEERHDEDVD
jgi:uncharacterized membrane protein